MDRAQEIKRLKQLIKQVNRVLSERWDPIGVGDEDPEVAYSEYDSYAPKIAGMVFNGVTVEELADHLEHIRSTEMGLGGKSSIDLEVSQMLVGLLDR